MDEEPILFYTRDGEYGFLSNFTRAEQMCMIPPWVRGSGDIPIRFPTNEHYFQACKADNIETFLWIVGARDEDDSNPFLAMKAGRSLRPGKELVDGWDDLRVGVMLDGLRAKFSQNADLKEKLLATGDRPIHEDSPTDSFWGWNAPSQGNIPQPGFGKDMLGKLLVQVREELLIRN